MLLSVNFQEITAVGFVTLTTGFVAARRIKVKML